MEKKVFEVKVIYIITYFKKSDPYIFIVKNKDGEKDFYREVIKIEGVGFNEEKAKDIIRDSLIKNILSKGTLTTSQKMIFQKSGMRKYLCKYYITVNEDNLNIKGDFVEIHKAMSIKEKMSEFLREFLINYVSSKRDLFEIPEER
ncbi:MAG TPA: hypothetical protein PKW55_06515 [Spirochaetota bacterium]|nr:hypothetical protein [Spirochaetota bacterium]HOM38537.1 hypothetical protein [Spirochaetota bacterium]HPQ49077.1 hypothetical protein [Spirochaetota bacterium]